MRLLWLYIEGNRDSVTAHPIMASPAGSKECCPGGAAVAGDARLRIDHLQMYELWLLCMKCFLLLCFFPLVCFSAPMPAFSGIEVPLSGDRTLDVDLAEARLISELQGYAIIAGRSCVDCDENTAIYFEKIDDEEGWSHPPQSAEDTAGSARIDGSEDSAVQDNLGIDLGEGDEGGESSRAAEEDVSEADSHRSADHGLTGERFSYPGKYRDYLSKKLVEKTRMFYGRCYENSPAVLWLSEYLTKEGWVKAEYLIVFRDDEVEHRYNENRQPSIYYIENADCREVPGMEMTTEP